MNALLIFFARALAPRNRYGASNAPDFYPIQGWVLAILKRYPMPKRILTCARLVKGHKISENIPIEVACANSVTGLFEMVDPSFFGRPEGIDRINGTATLLQVLKNSPRFRELATPQDGCIVINATGTGNGKVRGHTGVYDGGRVWNNSSTTGLWSNTFSISQWKSYFQIRGGMPTRYFLPLY